MYIDTYIYIHIDIDVTGVSQPQKITHEPHASMSDVFETLSFKAATPTLLLQGLRSLM